MASWSSAVQYPYHCIEVHDSILFAARGSNIHSFGLNSGGGIHLSTWTYPNPKPSSSPASEKQASRLIDSPVPEAVETPPAKRRKVDESKCDGGGQMVEIKDVSYARRQQGGRIASPNAGDSGTTKKQKPKPKHPSPNLPDMPVISHLTITPSGSHLVAVTSHDKAIWVLKHDGSGGLKELSRRVMPKRPCSITIRLSTHDIISADKFGDVYLLPLVDYGKTAEIPESESFLAPGTLANTHSPLSTADPGSQPAPKAKPSSSSSSLTPVSVASPSGATSLTVHTARNRQALSHQLANQLHPTQQMARDPSILAFTYQLLLGHVSMLTCVAVAQYCQRDVTGTLTGENREYILTADRDEHIRVSRSVPQAHIIETFCLGHKEFVSAFCLLENANERARCDSAIKNGDDLEEKPWLLSAGGDPDVYLWDWLGGKLISKTSLFPAVRQIAPDAAKMCVSGMVPVHCSTSTTTKVAIACERVPALFILAINFFASNSTAAPTVTVAQTITLPGNPLSVRAVCSMPGKVAVSLDCGSTNKTTSLSSSCNSRTLPLLSIIDVNAQKNDASTEEILFSLTASTSVKSEPDFLVCGDIPPDLEALRSNVFYTAEQLRKQESSWSEKSGRRGGRDKLNGNDGGALSTEVCINEKNVGINDDTLED